MKTETILFKIFMGIRRKGILTISKETGLPAKRIRQLMSGSPGKEIEWKMILNSLGMKNFIRD